MKKLLALLVAFGLVTGFAVFAEGDKNADKNAEVAADAAKDIELTGKIVKKEQTGKKEEKAGKKDGEKHVVFILEMADGKAMLPKGKDDATNPEKFLDKNVTIKGKGFTKDGKEGKKMTKITEITSITEVAAAK